MQIMSDTPRTDQQNHELLNADSYTTWLERELYEANQQIKRLEEELGDAYSEIRMHESIVSKVFNYVVLQRAKEAKL